jgi:hypothetical protein
MISVTARQLKDYALAVRAERIDMENWLDDFRAAPAEVESAMGLSTYLRDQLAMVRSRIPFSHFNMVMTLGCPAVVNQAAFDDIDRFYAEVGCDRHWILVNDYSQPASLVAQLVARGYEPDGHWDRVIAQDVRFEPLRTHIDDCEFVTRDNADAWSQFVVNCYGMPSVIAGWLKALVGRPGWIHAFRRESGRADAGIAMARSLYHDVEGWAWLGIDAPVPGVMAPCYADDQKVTAALVAAAAASGARGFVSDIEAPSPSRQGEAYERWAELGFSVAYRRRLFCKMRTR